MSPRSTWFLFSSTLFTVFVRSDTIENCYENLYSNVIIQYKENIEIDIWRNSIEVKRWMAEADDKDIAAHCLCSCAEPN